jgi:hypothetical protein
MTSCGGIKTNKLPVDTTHHYSSQLPTSGFRAIGSLEPLFFNFFLILVGKTSCQAARKTLPFSVTDANCKSQIQLEKKKPLINPSPSAMLRINTNLRNHSQKEAGQQQ